VARQKKESETPQVNVVTKHLKELEFINI
jgi:hypothetical protein